MQQYHAPELIRFGSLAKLTARVGSATQDDLFYSAKGIVEDSGSIDSCEFDQNGNVISDPPCPF